MPTDFEVQTSAEHARSSDLARSAVRPSIKPALFVVGLAVLLLLAFGIGALLTSTRPAMRPSPSSRTHLQAIPASRALKGIESPTTPPLDVRNAIFLPKGSTTIDATPSSGGTLYSANADLEVQGSQSDVVAFFRIQLKATGWRVVSTGPAMNYPNAIEVIAQRASSDGWYWEFGAVVKPSTINESTDVTAYRVSIFEVTDNA